MPVNLDYLSQARVQQMLLGLQDPRLQPAPLKWLDRTRVTDAPEGELVGRFDGRVVMADLISDDAAGRTIEAGRFQFERNVSPNIKLGRALSQSNMNQLWALRSILPAGGTGRDMMEAYLFRETQALLAGYRQRQESLIVAMLTNSFSYSRFGITITNANWGMPSDLNVTPSVPWTTAATATPIADLLSVNQTASVRYGQTFNRATMSLSVLNLITATTEFQNRVRYVLFPAMPVSMLPLQNQQEMAGYVGRLVNMDIELYDQRAWVQHADGTLTSSPYLPVNKVLLTNSADDNNPNIWDFSNGMPTESLVGQMGGNNVIGGFGAPQFGPVSYATTPADLNPPQLVYWIAGRGWPRRNLLQCSAVLNVGTVTDSIPVTLPAFPS